MKDTKHNSTRNINTTPLDDGESNPARPVGVTSSNQGGDPLCLPDLSRLRLSQNFVAEVGVKKQLLAVPVRKPNRHEWVWVRPEPEYQLVTALFRDKSERDDMYLVDPSLWDELAGEVMPFSLRVAMNRQAVTFILPVALPGPDGRTNLWHSSLADAVDLATAQWVRIASDTNLGAYNALTASASWPAPEWPDADLQRLLDLAFKGRYITSADHPILLRLRGVR